MNPLISEGLSGGPKSFCSGIAPKRDLHCTSREGRGWILIGRSSSKNVKHDFYLIPVRVLLKLTWPRNQLGSIFHAGREGSHAAPEQQAWLVMIGPSQHQVLELRFTISHDTQEAAKQP